MIRVYEVVPGADGEESVRHLLAEFQDHDEELAMQMVDDVPLDRVVYYEKSSGS